jgi:hypothetical protein
VKSGEAKGGTYVTISKCNCGMSHFAIVMGPVRVWRKNNDIAITYLTRSKSQVDLAISGDSLHRTPSFSETKKGSNL